MKLKDVAQVTKLMERRKLVKDRLDRFAAGEVDSIHCTYGNSGDAVHKRSFGNPEFWTFLKALVVDRLEGDIRLIDAELYALGVEPDDD